MHGINDRFDFRAPVPGPDTLGRVHLVAIGGAGMSAVARLLLARGVEVTGSDAKDSATLRDLEAAGATVWVGHDAEHVEGAHTVVVSSAIREGNVELVRARELGLLVLHRAQALASVMADSRAVAVAGANGKTTTTSMAIAALRAAGQDPSFASGGVLADLDTNAQWHPGSPFVVEADESDGSFLVYRPAVAIVTNVQPDHLDFYGTFAAVRAAYAEFAATITEGGLLVACADDNGSRSLADAVRGGADARGVRVLTYGTAADADARVLSSEPVGLGTRSVVMGPDGVPRELTVATPGAHNVLNALAAFTAAVWGLGADPDRVLAGLAGFGGARRRFEVRGEVDGVLVVDDYAHNPGKVSAVVATASAIARRGGGRLLVVFQPHLFSRTRDFAREFADGLAPADEIVLLDVYGAREDPIPGVGSELIAAELAAAGTASPVRVADREAALDHLVATARSGDILLTVGAGDVTDLAPLLLDRLGAR